MHITVDIKIGAVYGGLSTLIAKDLHWLIAAFTTRTNMVATLAAHINIAGLAMIKVLIGMPWCTRRTCALHNSDSMTCGIAMKFERRTKGLATKHNEYSAHACTVAISILHLGQICDKEEPHVVSNSLKGFQDESATQCRHSRKLLQAPVDFNPRPYVLLTKYYKAVC